MADPKAYTKASLTGVDDEHPSLHAAYNDDLVLEVDDGFLIGRPPGPGRGSAQSIPIGAVPAYANAAAFPALPLSPAGTTLIGFDRDANQLKVWDPDAGAWIAV